MKRVSSLIGVAVVLTAFSLPASGAEVFGAGRNGANGMPDSWAKPKVTAREKAPVVLGAGRRGADGMTDPWYEPPVAHKSAGDGPTSPDNSVPNGH